MRHLWLLYHGQARRGPWTRETLRPYVACVDAGGYRLLFLSNAPFHVRRGNLTHTVDFWHRFGDEFPSATEFYCRQVGLFLLNQIVQDAGVILAPLGNGPEDGHPGIRLVQFLAEKEFLFLLTDLICIHVGIVVFAALPVDFHAGNGDNIKRGPDGFFMVRLAGGLADEFSASSEPMIDEVCLAAQLK
jgi:hypothetical protein